jgi:hypothetical protein
MKDAAIAVDILACTSGLKDGCQWFLNIELLPGVVESFYTEVRSRHERHVKKPQADLGT